MSSRWLGRPLVVRRQLQQLSRFAHSTAAMAMATSTSSSTNSLRNRDSPLGGARAPARELHLHRHGPAASSSSTSAHDAHPHGHAHGHTHGGIEETQQLASAVASLRNPSALDPGSRITLVGLVSNVGLTAVKGVAGYVLASSALLADAAHSGSDLVADVVTLVSYRIGRWKPSPRYPYGYGKFESLGSLVVSFLLFATAAGIGLHSYHHLLLSLSTIPSIPADLLASLDFLPHGHVHGGAAEVSDLAGAAAAASTSAAAAATASGGGGSGVDAASAATIAAGADGLVDARAMYFALFSILVKEWLYRATLKVARAQHSNVLLANAYHHRSDSLGSLVALLAIGAARIGYPMLDPVGGLVVAGMIAKQGFDIGKESLGGLVDQVTDDKVQPDVHDAIRQLSRHRDEIEPYRKATKGKLLPHHGSSGLHGADAPEQEQQQQNTAEDDDPAAADEFTPSHSSYADLPILAIPSVRLFASGPSLLIDVEVVLPASLTLAEANEIERQCAQRVRQVVGAERVREVVVRCKAEGHDQHQSPGEEIVVEKEKKKEQ